MNLLSFIIFTVALQTLTNYNEKLKTYSVKKITGTLNHSGKGDDPVWASAYELADFDYPWEKDTPPPTKFRALHNDDWLYVLFEVHDPNVNILQDKNDKSEVASSSRAEIFFKRDDKLTPYYCLEIDPLARVLDYEGTYHRKFDLNWNWPVGHIVVKTGKIIDGYTVELAISKSSLNGLGLLKGNILETGLYRADCSVNTAGNYTFKWISWIKPDSKTPDFHIPSSFGILRLEE